MSSPADQYDRFIVKASIGAIILAAACFVSGYATRAIVESAARPRPPVFSAEAVDLQAEARTLAHLVAPLVEKSLRDRHPAIVKGLAHNALERKILNSHFDDLVGQVEPQLAQTFYETLERLDRP